MKKISILFVHYGDDWIRGSERCLLDLLSNIDRNRFDIHVWCNSTVLEAELKKSDIHVIRSRFSILWGYSARKWDLLNWVKLIRMAVKIIQDYNIDLVHSNSGGPAQWNALACRITNTPWVLQLHARYGVAKDRYSLFLHHACRIVGVSKAALHPISQDVPSGADLKVIHNGIDFARLDGQHTSNLRSELSIPEDEIVLATIGSLIDRKGIDKLIRIVQRIHKMSITPHFIVVGDGENRHELRLLVKQLGLDDYVHFLGDRPNAFAIIRDNADIYLSGASDEVFGLVLAEAGYAGLPSVAYAVGGIPEVIDNNRTGLLCALDDEEQFSKAVIELVKDKGRRETMGATSKKSVKTRFSIRHNVRSFEEEYKDVVSVGRRDVSLEEWWGYLRGLIRYVFQRFRLA